MFRYERPQKGRQRQFHQIDIEVIGAPEPAADIEVIAVGAQILRELGVLDKTTLEINSLGDPESRANYRDVLVTYFGDHRDKLSEDSLNRLERNPMRILDSKDEGDRAIVAEAPVLSDYLNQVSTDFFSRVREGLDALGIDHEVSPRLVRGLDYYTHTAFEFTTTELGAQGAVIAGGRYDGLIETLGGKPTPGIGWAGGIERLAMLAGEPPAPQRPVAVVPVGAEAEAAALTTAERLRRAGFAVEMDYGGGVKRRMKKANRANAACALLMGEDELARNAATVRDLDSGEQTDVPLESLEDHLARYR
jgi:histidyl-tRNA synthetase